MQYNYLHVEYFLRYSLCKCNESSFVEDLVLVEKTAVAWAYSLQYDVANQCNKKVA